MKKGLKIITGLLMAVTMINLYPFFMEQKIPKNVDKNIGITTNIEINPCHILIDKYQLTLENDILSHQEFFLKYYNAIKQNSDLDLREIRFYLNFFDYFVEHIEHIDKNHIIKNISSFHLSMPQNFSANQSEETKNKNVAARTFGGIPPKIEIYTYNDLNDYQRILKHESFHLFSYFENWSLITNLEIKNNVIKINDINPQYQNVGWIFVEAMTEILTNEYNKYLSNKVYRQEVLALKILVELIGSEVFISAFNQANGGIKILQELEKITNDAHYVVNTIIKIDDIVSNLETTLPHNYYSYYEFLYNLYKKSQTKNAFIDAYFDDYKISLLNSVKLEILKTENSQFYDYLISDNYLTKLSQKPKSINIVKNYFKKNNDISNITVIYNDGSEEIINIDD